MVIVVPMPVLAGELEDEVQEEMDEVLAAAQLRLIK